MISSVAVVAYLSLFVLIGLSFLFANLVLGRFLRPHAPNVEKLEVYECGEPTIGSSFVQFDLRFYVVALLFIIFDVEIAFFFPWANVFGKATQLANPDLARAAAVEVGQRWDPTGQLPPWNDPAAPGHAEALESYRQLVDAKCAELGLPAAAANSVTATTLPEAAQEVEAGAARLVRFSMIDIATFFAVLMVGFAYVWRRGDLDWVRAVSNERARASRTKLPAAPGASREPLVGV